MLALRCLIVGLLSFAFAKPFIERAADSAATSGNDRDRVIVLDRSLSMQSASRWNEALKMARESIDALDDGERGALVLFDYETLLAQELTADHGLLRGALADAEAGDGNTDLAGAITRTSCPRDSNSPAIRPT